MIGMALIVASGAQNAFVLRTRYPTAACIGCAGGMRDFRSRTDRNWRVQIRSGWSPANLDVVAMTKLGGTAFLICYGLLAARSVCRPSVLKPIDSAPA